MKDALVTSHFVAGLGATQLFPSSGNSYKETELVNTLGSFRLGATIVIVEICIGALLKIGCFCSATKFLS